MDQVIWKGLQSKSGQLLHLAMALTDPLQQANQDVLNNEPVVGAVRRRGIYKQITKFWLQAIEGPRRWSEGFITLNKSAIADSPINRHFSSPAAVYTSAV
eukprot:6443861-Amphidinium_carterae.1